nr:hypothetical protein [uncultured Tyzzerella sp.]
MKELEEIYNKINNLNYLLDRKLQLLGLILDITKSQKNFFDKDENNEINSFINLSVEEKQKLIDELVSIDNMFLTIFESFKGGLNQNKKIFEKELKQLQQKIQQIADTDLKIRLQEEKNKQTLNNVNNINNNINTIDKVKTLKLSKSDLLKKYNDNNNKI